MDTKRYLPVVVALFIGSFTLVGLPSSATAQETCSYDCDPDIGCEYVGDGEWTEDCDLVMTDVCSGTSCEEMRLSDLDLHGTLEFARPNGISSNNLTQIADPKQVQTQEASGITYRTIERSCDGLIVGRVFNKDAANEMTNQLRVISPW